jgi:hypothetical protein
MADAATALAQFAPVGTPDPEPPPIRWRVWTRIAFRFWSIYFGLYVLTTQMLGGLLPFMSGDLSSGGPIRWMVEWVAKNLFGVTTALVVSGSGSGDKTFDWVHSFCFLVMAAVFTMAWSAAARRVAHHETAHKWFRLFLRFALATTLLSYGSAKFIPLQMPFPGLTRLLEPYGNFSPMGVLWASIGASRSYEVFTGLAEATAAILLFVPRTTTLGALVSLGCTIEIFTLNMTYDVPVKLFSFHLILMSLYLLAPDMRRLVNVLLLNRVAEPSSAPALFATPRGNRIGLAAQLILAVTFVGLAINSSMSAWTQYGGGAPKSPLYGIWNVTYMSIDGVERPPLVTDYARWRRVTFDRPTAMAFHRMDDSFAAYPITIDAAGKSIALTRTGDQNWKATLTYDRPADNRLILAGEMDGRKLDMRLELFPRERFLLVTRGFNWIQEYPLNR